MDSSPLTIMKYGKDSGDFPVSPSNSHDSQLDFL